MKVSTGAKRSWHKAQSRKPLANVTVTLTHSTVEKRKSKKKFQVVKKTKVQGGFKVMHLPPGKYNVVARKTGYKDAEMELIIAPSELVKIIVILEKI